MEQIQSFSLQQTPQNIHSLAPTNVQNLGHYFVQIFNTVMLLIAKLPTHFSTQKGDLRGPFIFKKGTKIRISQKILH